MFLAIQQAVTEKQLAAIRAQEAQLRGALFDSARLRRIIR